MRDTTLDSQDRLRELVIELTAARRRLTAALDRGDPDGDLTPEARDAATRVRELEDQVRQLLHLP